MLELLLLKCCLTDAQRFLCSGAEFPWIPKPMPPSGPLLPKEEIMEIIQGSPILVLNIAGDADNSTGLLDKGGRLRGELRLLF